MKHLCSAEMRVIIISSVHSSPATSEQKEIKNWKFNSKSKFSITKHHKKVLLVIPQSDITSLEPRDWLAISATERADRIFRDASVPTALNSSVGS